MQTDTVGSFYSSVMIICIHNDNLLIPRHLKCIHDFKKHFDYLSMSLAFSHPQSCFYARLDDCVLEKIHDSFMSQVVRRKFGNTNLRKRPHPLLLSRCLRFVAIILAFCGKNSLAIRTHQKGHSTERVQITPGKRLIYSDCNTSPLNN